MKILVTGMTSRQVGSDRIKMRYAQAADALVTLLRSHPDCSVEWRRAEWGEDLSKYDLILTGVHKIGTMAVVVKNLMGLAWIHQTARTKMVNFYDDWSAMHTIGGAKTLIKTWAKRMAFYQQGCPMTGEQENILATYISTIADSAPVIGALIPAFPWAEKFSLIDRFPKAEKTLLWDPTSFSDVMRSRPAEGMRDALAEGKCREWLLATLQDHTKWVGDRYFKWPVRQVGVKSLGQPQITETEVKAFYDTTWGVLAPAYPAPGWWRARFYHAASAQSVLLCDPTDARLMSSRFQKTVSAIEGLTNGGLIDLAAEQEEFIRDSVTGAEFTRAQVFGFLRSL